MQLNTPGWFQASLHPGPQSNRIPFPRGPASLLHTMTSLEVPRPGYGCQRWRPAAPHSHPPGLQIKIPGESLMGPNGPCAHLSTNHRGQEDGVSGPTWVSGAPWAGEGCGCQDLRGYQAVHPLRPLSLVRPPQAPRTQLETYMGSVSHPGPWMLNPLPLTAGPQKKAGETFRLIAWRSAAPRDDVWGV